jgi:hypothetical protein
MLYQRGRQFRRRNPTDRRFLFGIGDPSDAVSEFRIPCFFCLFLGKNRRKRSVHLPSGRPTLKVGKIEAKFTSALPREWILVGCYVLFCTAEMALPWGCISVGFYIRFCTAEMALPWGCIPVGFYVRFCVAEMALPWGCTPVAHARLIIKSKIHTLKLRVWICILTLECNIYIDMCLFGMAGLHFI